MPHPKDNRTNPSTAGIVAHRLRQAREDVGLSQRELGVRAGLDPSVASPRINQYERDKHIPNPTVLSQLGAVLGVPVAYFFAVDDDLALAIIAIHRAAPSRRKQWLHMMQAGSESNRKV